MKQATTTAFISQYADNIDRKNAIESMTATIERNMSCKVISHKLTVVDPRRGFKSFFPVEVYEKAKKSKLIGLVMVAEIEKK